MNMKGKGKKRKRKNRSLKELNHFNNTKFIHFYLELPWITLPKTELVILYIDTTLKKMQTILIKSPKLFFKKEIEIYKFIFNIIDGCIIVNENNYSITIEIDSENHRHLLDDISKKFSIIVIKRRRADFRSNLFFTIKI